jgi:hypothetical protein
MIHRISERDILDMQMLLGVMQVVGRAPEKDIKTPASINEILSFTQGETRPDGTRPNRTTHACFV